MLLVIEFILLPNAPWNLGGTKGACVCMYELNLAPFVNKSMKIQMFYW